MFIGYNNRADQISESGINNQLNLRLNYGKEILIISIAHLCTHLRYSFRKMVTPYHKPKFRHQIPPEQNIRYFDGGRYWISTYV